MKPAPPDKASRHWLDAWHVDPSANRNYDFIDGLRGLAILMVLTTHSIYADTQTGLAGRLVLSLTYTLGHGVALFFTISGFLIAWPFWKRKANGAECLIPHGYGWRRFWKIYPPMALSVLLLTPCYIMTRGNAPLYIHTAIQWLTGLAFVVPTSGQFNTVMWSLVVEIHFYLVLPLLFLLTKRLPAKTCLWILSLCFFVVPVSIQWLTGASPTLTPEIDDPFCTGLSSFCFGVCVAGIDALKLWSKSWVKIGEVGWPVMVFGLLGQAFVRLNPPEHAAILTHLFHWIFMLGTGFLLCYAAAPDNPRARWLCAPWLRWCGIISYEWYLFHQPLLGWARAGFGPAHGNVFKYALVLAVPLLGSALLSALIYRRFSLPILKFGRAKKAAQKS